MDHLPKNINRSIFKNAVSQTGGRLFLSVARLGIASMIVRYAGPDRFGEYSLLLSLLLIAEWLVDFGLTEISVRNICQSPDRRGIILRTITLARLTQGFIAVLVLFTALYSMGYPPNIVRAGAVGAIGLFFYSGILVYRTVFKIRMRMELDVFSEAIGVLLSIPLVWYACSVDAPVEILIACYMASRLVFFLCALFLGRNDFKLNIRGIEWQAVLTVFLETLPLGTAGLLVCVYDNLAPIMLAELASTDAIAYYSSASRFVFPIIVIIQSINGAFYPLLSSYWGKSSSAFATTQQAALDSSILVSAALFCTINAGAEFLMDLIGPTMHEASAILRLMSWVVIARSVTTSMSPLIIIAGAPNRMLWLAVLSVVCQIGGLLWLIPLYGAWGATITYLLIELVISLGPIIVISQYLTGIRLNWRIPVRALLAAVIALQICRLLNLTGTLAGAVFTFIAYAILAVAMRAVSLNKLRKIAESLKSSRRSEGNADCEL